MILVLLIIVGLTRWAYSRNSYVGFFATDTRWNLETIWSGSKHIPIQWRWRTRRYCRKTYIFFYCCFRTWLCYGGCHKVDEFGYNVSHLFYFHSSYERWVLFCCTNWHSCRYYGGIKLGTGGLVRAYGGVALDCLKEGKTIVLKAEVCHNLQYQTKIVMVWWV